MEITYLGHSCFKLKNKEGMVVVIDPYKSEMVGMNMTKEVADILIMSHQHEDHNAREAIIGPVKRQSVFVIENEGEYEIGGIEISCMRTSHDKNDGKERGKNLVTAIRLDGLNLLHLGDLGHKLTDGMIEKIGDVDLLMIPVGGFFTMDMGDVNETIKDIQPSYVIPMHFRKEGMKPGFELVGTLEAFLEKNKFPVTTEPVHKIKVDESSLPDDTQVLLMNV